MSAIQTETRSDLAPWVSFIRAHASIVRTLSAELVAAHGLTINDYEVLLRLSRTPDKRMRRVDLAQEVLLSPSGITRLLVGLERAGLVERASCDSDARVVYAQLTPAGLAKLRSAAKTHLAGVDRVFLDRFDEDERATLGDLLGRLAAAGDEPCEPE
jgi:DNA-binding MarR family transcriptional regulator